MVFLYMASGERSGPTTEARVGCCANFRRDVGRDVQRRRYQPLIDRLGVAREAYPVVYSVKQSSERWVSAGGRGNLGLPNSSPASKIAQTFCNLRWG